MFQSGVDVNIFMSNLIEGVAKVPGKGAKNKIMSVFLHPKTPGDTLP